MKLARLIPLLVGVGVLVFGIYLVSSHGYLGGTYLPGLIGIQPCNTSTNSSSGFTPGGSGCTGFALYGGYGIGTIVCLFGLGLIGNSLRGAMAMSMAGSSSPHLPPELSAALTSMQSRMPPGFPPPGAQPGTVYCSRCGAANPVGAKFCHQCAGPISSPGAAPPPGPTPPASGG